MALLSVLVALALPWSTLAAGAADCNSSKTSMATACPGIFTETETELDAGMIALICDNTTCNEAVIAANRSCSGQQEANNSSNSSMNSSAASFSQMLNICTPCVRSFWALQFTCNFSNNDMPTYEDLCVVDSECHKALKITETNCKNTPMGEQLDLETELNKISQMCDSGKCAFSVQAVGAHERCNAGQGTKLEAACTTACNPLFCTFVEDCKGQVDDLPAFMNRSTPVTPLTVMRPAEAILGDLVASLANKSSVSASTSTGEVQVSKLEVVPGLSAAVIQVNKTEGLASQLVDVRLYEVLGDERQELKPTGLETPIQITVLANWSSSPGAYCAFWDEAAEQWSAEGLTESESVSGALVCTTTHLTIFAALRWDFLYKLVEQLKCTNVRMLALHSESDGSWTYRPGGLLLWFALIASSGFVIYSNQVDVAMKKSGLWDDGCFITQVPKGKRTPMGCLNVAGGAATFVPQQLSLGLELRTTEAGMHAFLSRSSGLTVRTINRHYWNRDGFVQGDLAVETSMPLAHMFEEFMGHLAPWFLELYGETLGFSGRFRLLFHAVHPILQVRRFDLEASAVKRSMLLVDEILGGLVISALFFSASASALSVSSSALCEQTQYDATRFVLIGLVSSSFVRLPLALAAYMTLRFFVHEDLWGDDAQKNRQLRRWQLTDCATWAVGSTYRLLCVFFLVAFLNDLHGLDEWKWVLSFVCVLLRSILLLPAAHALLLTLAVELVRRADPQFVAAGHPQLGFSHKPSPDIHPKVLDLATRSMTVDDLLHFYNKLGTEVMPHFDPRTSTTHDVVRQAIIPLSGAEHAGDAGSAYATVVANGQPRLPQKLVTHNWSNIFSHLIAAVLADCMNSQTFENSLAMLLEPQGLEALRKRLAHKLHHSYWICIFSVNQHTGICATPPEADLRFARDAHSALYLPPGEALDRRSVRDEQVRRHDGLSDK
ncbi:unnamed protein product, partial [Polarella glacialis]